MGLWQPSRLKKALAGLWCAGLLRKGPLCCTTKCLCCNELENAQATQARADEYVICSCSPIRTLTSSRARWKYQSEKLESRRSARERSAEKRTERKARRKASRTARYERRSSRREDKEARKETRRVEPDIAKGSSAFTSTQQDHHISKVEQGSH